jgi:mono/diheme cytochrome c family protein
MSYSPQTGLVYFPTHRFAIDYTHESPYEHREGFWNLGVIIDLFPDDPKVRAAIKNSVSGALVAWDPVNAREVWRARRRGPLNGGTLSVAGGLVFQGTGDGSFLAMNAETGKEVWSYDTQAATLAGPVSYQVDGEQHIAVAAGYGTAFFLIEGVFAAKDGAPINARVYSFKLGGSAPKPVIPLQRIPTPKPPVFATTPEEYREGAGLYDRFCLACHGVAAITGGVLPDLRKTPRLQDASAWFGALTDGELQSRGMPQFRNHVSEKDAELIRTYVARQAGFLYADEEAAGKPAQLR